MTLRYHLICLFLLLLISIIFFFDLLSPYNTLFTTDDNIGNVTFGHNLLPAGFVGFWDDHSLIGLAANLVPITATSILQWMLPPTVFVDWIHAIYLVMASFMLFCFLRISSLDFVSAFFGGLVFAWLGSNFTLTYAGHIPKFAILAFAATYLFFIRKMALNHGKWQWAILAGLSLGLMFAEQQDVAIFFSVVLAPYTLLVFFQMEQTIRKKIISFALIPIIALLFAAPALLSAFATNIAGTAVVEDENEKAKWEFATQWSWPPEESIDFIAPGYMGWRSGEPEGPYWGRMGRSSGWETTGQGFMNFKLENQYIGLIPIFFAIIPLLALAIKDKQDFFAQLSINWRIEMIFWLVALAVTLLLSFGKFFPLYYFFYQLPLINSIRNPNKFLQVFQLALAILAAYGFEFIVRHATKQFAIGVPKKSVVQLP